MADQEIKWTEVDSSNIGGVHYKEKSRELLIKFKKNQKVYSYSPVTQDGFALLMGAESIGSFFAKFIKGNPNIRCKPV